MEPIRLVSTYDSALDVIALGGATGDVMVEYLRTLDSSKLVARPGMSLTYFTVRPIPERIMRRVVRAAPTTDLKHELAFQWGVSRIENLVSRDGTAHPLIEASFRQAGDVGNLTCLSEEQLDAVPATMLYEIGGMSLAWNSATGKGERVFLVQPCSLAGLKLLGSLRVDEARRALAESSKGSSGGTRRARGSKSGERGGATATGSRTGPSTTPTPGSSASSARSSTRSRGKASTRKPARSKR